MLLATHSKVLALKAPGTMRKNKPSRLAIVTYASDANNTESVEENNNENTFINEHKENMRELRKLLLEKRKELERKRVANFHQVKDAATKSANNMGDAANQSAKNLRTSLTAFAQSEIEFVRSLFPEAWSEAGCCNKTQGDHISSTDEVTPEVLDPLDAKMDPDYQPPSKQ